VLDGSSRLGVVKSKHSSPMMPFHFFAAGTITLGYKQYELSNHLGNVLTTIADNVLRTAPAMRGGQVGLMARIVSTQDYYPFGMGMVERAYQEPTVNNERNYRYGFNGMERDSEWGEGMYDFEARTLDVRLGRFLSVDRQEASFPSNSPYSYCFNNPLLLTDTSGEYPQSAAVKFIQESTGVKLSPAVAGVIDGLIEGNSIFAALKLGKDMLDPAKRQQMYDAAAAIASDPMGFIKEVAKEEYNRLKNIVQMNEEGQYEAGFAVGEKISNVITGGFLGIAGKFLKSLTKAKVEVPTLKGKTTQSPCKCFLAGTIVKTKQGDKPIEDVQEGDYLLAQDIETGEIAYKKVLKKHIIQENKELYWVYLSGEVIKVTGQHPFRIGKEWVEVQYLHKGDSVTLYTGKKVAIDSIATYAGQYTVYTFTVEDFHTYYVSASGVLVKNCDWKKRYEANKGRADELSSKYGDKIGKSYLDAKMGNLRKAIKNIADDEQAHHIIPTELLSNNPTVQKAVKEGFDFNKAINGIGLTKDRHNGSHPDYTKWIEKQISHVQKQNPSMSAKAVVEKVAALAKQTIVTTTGNINNIK
jgi:RHS repeat-associated protein